MKDKQNNENNVDSISYNLQVDDNENPTSTSISASPLTHSLEEGETKEVVITGLFVDPSGGSGISNAGGSFNVLLENGDAVASNDFKSISMNRSNDRMSATVTATVYVRHGDLNTYGDNELGWKLQVRDLAGNSVISDVAAHTATKLDSVDQKSCHSRCMLIKKMITVIKKLTRQHLMKLILQKSMLNLLLKLKITDQVLHQHLMVKARILLEPLSGGAKW